MGNRGRGGEREREREGRREREGERDGKMVGKYLVWAKLPKTTIGKHPWKEALCGLEKNKYAHAILAQPKL